MAELTNVKFYGTGGGCVMFTALVNGDAWLATDFEMASYYDKPYEEVDNDFLENNVEYTKHEKAPSDPLPTWGEILESIRENFPGELTFALMCMEHLNMENTIPQGWNAYK